MLIKRSVMNCVTDERVLASPVRLASLSVTMQGAPISILREAEHL